MRSPGVHSQRPIRGADLFCGSGGFSTALVRACAQLFPGRPLDLVAVNHWQIAIDTHQLNHPKVRHFCADLEHLKPLDAVPGGILDILLAAPACTYHSRARGGKPVHDQMRMDPWHVVRWCTELRVHRLIVENVPEFVDWGPCHAITGKPLKKRKGEYFRAWVQALKAVGMRVDWKFLTCANYGDATTRERFFLYGRSDKKALRWPEASHSKTGDPDLFGSTPRWRSAAEIIDWSRLGTSIFTRKRPLVDNTLCRLLSGASRNNWPVQYIDALQALLDGKTPRLLVSREEAEEIALQIGTSLVMAPGSGGTARGVDQPIPTAVTGASAHFAEPIILHKANSDGGRSSRGVNEPAPTVLTNGAGALVQPIIAPYYGGGSGRTAKGADEPLPAQGTKDRFSLAQPTLIRAGHGDDGHLVDGRVLDPADPLPTVTGSNDIGVATPFLVPNFGEAPGQKPRTHSIDQPAPAITATGHIQLAAPFLFRPNQGDGRFGSSRSVEEPAPTLTCSESIALAKPFVSLCTHNGTGAGRGVDEPIPTVTTAKGGEMTLAAPTLAEVRETLREIAESYYIDILYRMLHWTELSRATSFDDEGEVYEFTGTATEITKQIGNAVPLRTGKALCVSILEGA